MRRIKRTGIIAQLEAGAQIAEIGGLASVETLHAVTPKSNAKGARFLALIDRGLAQVMEQPH